ncbi:MAG: hypothetical protein JST44_10970 [Cyanobacteria bacterium SZAS LIN-5]|nr:hypothetical protein [Cyanobacteria bacterium SZAS LIN-5]
MDPVVATLIWTVIVVLVAPVIVACVFLSERKSHPLMIPWSLPSFRRPYFLLSVDERLARRIDRKYFRLCVEIETCGEELAASVSSEKSLQKEIRHSRRHRRSQHYQEKLNSEQRRLRDGRLKELEEQMAQQQQRTKLLREKKSDLDHSLSKLYTVKQIHLSKVSTEKTLNQTEKILKKVSSAHLEDRLTRAIEIVQAREASAMKEFQDQAAKQLGSKLWDKYEKSVAEFESKVQLLESGLAQPAQPSREDAILEKAILFGQHAYSRFNNLKSSLLDAVAAADSSVTNALSRLQSRLSQAREIAASSKDLEHRLEVSIASEQDRLEQLKNNVGVDVEGGVNAISLAASMEISIQSLSLSLDSIKRRNLSIQRILSYVDAITRRLVILKMLIDALPSSSRTMNSQIVQISNSVCSFLKSFSDCEKSQDSAVPADLIFRLHELEQNSLMSYIKIAKGEAEALSPKSLDRLKRDISNITAALDLERTDAASEFEKWSGISAAAEPENEKLLLAVAENRKARCSEIIQITEQTKEVLDLTVKMTQARLSNSKAS